MTFVDDVETVLAEHHQLMEAVEKGDALLSKENLNLTEPEEHASVDSLLEDYIKSTLNFTCSTSAGPLKITYLGKERDDDPYGMFIYFVVEAVQSRVKHKDPRQKAGLASKLELQSTYMLDLYEDQQNVVVWKLNGESADYDLLTFNTRTCDFER